MKTRPMNIRNKKIRTLFDNIDFSDITSHPNILIAARFWDDERYDAAKTCYKFMRYIDDLIDNRKAADIALNEDEKQYFSQKVGQWIRSLESLDTSDPFLKIISETVQRFKIPFSFFRNFSRSMIYDVTHDGFASWNDFLKYAEGASNGPASVFVHLCCLHKENNEYHPAEFDIAEAARPCALFSYLVHIIRDFQKDQNNHLNYFPLDILRKYHLDPDDLQKIAKTNKISDNFRQVVREYCDHAKLYKKQTLEVLERIKSQMDAQYLLSLYIIFDLYDQIFERIDIEKGTLSTAELNPTSDEIKNRVLRIIQQNETLLKNIN